jgi:iron(III) transport system permease protein
MTVALPASSARRGLGIDLSKPVLIAFAVILFLLIAMPLSWLVLYAFSSKTGAFTLDNFHRLLTDAAYLDPLLTTFALAILTALICCIVAAPMGWLVARTDMPLRRTVRLLVTASFVTPPFLGAIAWELLAAPNSGLLNQLYRELTGAEQGGHLFNIYSFTVWSLSSSCYTHIPLRIRFGRGRVDRTPGVSDASAILGGKAWDTARRVTIPLALPSIWRAHWLHFYKR